MKGEGGATDGCQYAFTSRGCEGVPEIGMEEQATTTKADPDESSPAHQLAQELPYRGQQLAVAARLAKVALKVQARGFELQQKVKMQAILCCCRDCWLGCAC